MAPLYLDSRSTCACGGRRCSQLDVYMYKSFTMALGGGGCAGSSESGRLSARDGRPATQTHILVGCAHYECERERQPARKRGRRTGGLRAGLGRAGTGREAAARALAGRVVRVANRANREAPKKQRFEPNREALNKIPIVRPRFRAGCLSLSHS